MKPYFPIILAAALLLACNPSDRSTISGDLLPGVPVEGTLEVETPDTFRLVLGPDMYLYGIVDQLTVDAVVTFYDWDWNVKGNFDGPGRGPEVFYFENGDPGTYYMVVAPFKKQSGDYRAELKVAEPVAEDPIKRADQLFMPFSGEIPGGVAGVVRGGELVFAKAYGMADLTHRVPFSVNTPSNIGSVSKQFTAMAILLLERQGKLSLDDDVRKHIPELPDLGQVVTIRNMLNHTNGFREVYNLMPMTGWKPDDQLRREEVIAMLKRQEMLQAAPGAEFNYNNSAFILLAEIVERISGQKFPVWMEENLFGPLDMGSTVVRGNPLTIVPGAAQGYTMDSAGYRLQNDLYAAYGAGGIYTTVDDLARWLGNFGHPLVGDTAAIARLTTPDTLSNGDTMTYALGIGVGEFRGLKQYSHGGADLAHRAMLVYFPEIDAGVAVMSNNASFPSDQVAYGLAGAFFSDELGPEEEAGKAASDSAAVVVPERLLRAYAGTYRFTAFSMVLKYRLEEGVLIVSSEGQPDLKMVPLSDSLFAYTGVDATIEFHLDANGKVVNGMHSQGGSVLELVPMAPYAPTADELREFTGRYYSNELETFYNLELRDTALVIRLRNSPEVVLSPLERDSFKGDTYFLSELKFSRDTQGSPAGFEVSNGRTRGIRFIRLP